VNDRTSLVERFRDFARAREIDLWEGALLVAGLFDPQEDLARARAEIERLATRIRVARGGSPDHETLARVLFAEEGLRGDSDSYDNPANSSVARVLEKKSGLPITLSIVAMEAGRRAGLRLTGVGLPGHFVVGGADLPDGTFLDVFDGGRLSDVDALTRRVSTIFGSPITLPEEAFAPDSPRAILMRMLFNLRHSWERREQFEEALAALACAEILAPEDASFLRERGLLLLRAGRSEDALEALEAYVRTAQGEDAEAVGKLVAIVREAVAGPGGELVSSDPPARRIFKLEQARELLPRVREITTEAVSRYAQLSQGGDSEEERQGIVRRWVREISSLGAEIKGLWLVDFDAGAGYYCWKHPEPALEYFHGYDEGFAGRLPLQ
jgi:regulator of sirC expression with transglutaminase-like and TPR domain